MVVVSLTYSFNSVVDLDQLHCNIYNIHWTREQRIYWTCLKHVALISKSDMYSSQTRGPHFEIRHVLVRYKDNDVVHLSDNVCTLLKTRFMFFVLQLNSLSARVRRTITNKAFILFTSQCSLCWSSINCWY